MKIFGLHRLCCLCLLAALGTSWGVCGEKSEWHFSGYVQARYNLWDDGTGQDDRWDLRRVRLKAQGKVAEGTSVTLQVELGKLDDPKDQEICLKDALLVRKLSPQWTGWLGFGKIPFGYEVPVSSSERLPLERSRIARWLFPGERHTALTFYYKPLRPAQPEIKFGYGNGIADWQDMPEQGDAEDFFFQLQWPLAHRSWAGASVMFSRREIQEINTDGMKPAAASPGTYNDTVWGVHWRYNAPAGWALQSEYYSGTILEDDIHGGYAQLEMPLQKKPLLRLFYRYDTADYAAKAYEYTGHVYGLAWDVSTTERLTLQAESLNTEKGDKQTNFAVQYQLKY